MKGTEVLSKTEISDLLKPSDLQGWKAVLTTWGMIAGSFALVALYPSVLTALCATLILGGRHLALAILMHDAAHYSLFRTRKLNDWVGRWLCGYPTWQDLDRYRVHHMKHHRYAGSDQDPDASLVRGFPLKQKSLMRKFLRDLTGVTGLKRVYGLLLMDFGFIEYTVASDARRIPQQGRSVWNIAKAGAKNLRGVLITNLALLTGLWLMELAELYGLWVVSYLTAFSVFVRVRSIAEHAGTLADLDPLKSTRTTLANPVARVTVAPHRVNYHLEHHLLMTVPYFNLPKLHNMLKERGALQGAFVAKGYFEVLRSVIVKDKI